VQAKSCEDSHLVGGFGMVVVKLLYTIWLGECCAILVPKYQPDFCTLKVVVVVKTYFENS
jgi:hypothetical protein